MAKAYYTLHKGMRLLIAASSKKEAQSLTGVDASLWCQMTESAVIAQATDTPKLEYTKYSGVFEEVRG